MVVMLLLGDHTVRMEMPLVFLLNVMMLMAVKLIMSFQLVQKYIVLKVILR